MTPKVIKIIVGDQQILVDKKSLKGLDLSGLGISPAGYVMLGRKYLHRVITNCPANLQVDHRNKDKLDNRICNLRICTNSENQWNRGKQKNNRSGFKGVSLNKSCKKKIYRARITADKKTYYLGSFKKSEAAGAAYRKAAKKFHGRFARITDPLTGCVL